MVNFNQADGAAMESIQDEAADGDVVGAECEAGRGGMPAVDLNQWFSSEAGLRGGIDAERAGNVGKGMRGRGLNGMGAGADGKMNDIRARGRVGVENRLFQRARTGGMDVGDIEGGEEKAELQGLKRGEFLRDAGQ